MSQFFAELAEREALVTHGANVSALTHGKSLNKFGRTENADAGAPTTVAVFQSTVVNETFATGNTIDRISSSSGSDTSDVTISGHTLNASDQMVAVEQTITLTGQTPVALTTALFRCNRVRTTAGTVAAPATALVGTVYVFDNTVATGTTAGVPDVATATKCLIVAGEQTSQKCATSIAYEEFYFVTGLGAAILRQGGASARADVSLEYRTLGGVWLPAEAQFEVSTAAQPGDHLEHKPWRIIPANSDVRMTTTADTADTYVSGIIHGMLAKRV